MAPSATTTAPPAPPAGRAVPPRPVPATIAAAFARADSVDAARAYTRRLALGHYENFSVVSLFVPRPLRQDFANVYAFCRTADDLGDEVGHRGRSLDLLARFKSDLADCYAGGATSLVFLPLAETVRKFDIPRQPFADLIDAFEQDQRVTRYDTFAQLHDYCRRSADPVGRLVLYLCGYRDERRQQLSDKTCTALQLANFWQDVRRDLLDVDRIYLPRETMARFGFDESDVVRQVRESRCEPNVRDAIRFEVERARGLFDDGDALLPLLAPRVASHVRLFAAGGRAVLGAIGRQGYDTLTRRPSVGNLRKASLLCQAVAARLKPSPAAFRREGTR